MINRRSFIVGIKSKKLSSKEINFLKKYKPWGIILFLRNIKDIQQTQKLTSSIRKLFNDKNIQLWSIKKGGKVNRLKNIITFDNLTSEYFGKNTLKIDMNLIYFISCSLIKLLFFKTTWY